MSQIILPPNNVGEVRAYIKALTGAQNVVIPDAPDPEELGQVLEVKSTYVSLDSSVQLGFGFGSASGSADVKVLLQDYWYYKEVDSTISEVNSWTFAVGFRVGIKIVGYKASLDVALGTLAAKAQTEGLNIQIQIIRVGMPKGPDVPVNLAVPVTLDVEKFGDLKTWEGSVISYVSEKRNELKSLLVSASINISGERLLNDTPGVRFALWKIYQGMKLNQAISLLKSGKVPEVNESIVRSVYSAIFHDPTMVVPGQPSENRIPLSNEKNAADNWINGYKNI